MKQFPVSKKLAVFLLSFVVLIFEEKLGIELSPETKNELIMLTSAYLVGQGVADHGKEAEKQRQRNYTR